MKYRFFLAALFFVKSLSSYAQPVLAGTELQELVKITQLYENVPSLSFVMFTFLKHASTPLDETVATCKLSYGKTLVWSEDFEFLKGDQYDVYVSREDSIVLAMPRRTDETILKAPLLDSTFRAAHVDSMWITSNNDSIWLFNVRFKPESIYSLYELEYNSRTGLINNIFYRVRNLNGAYGLLVDDIITVDMIMTSYSDAELDPSMFNEHKYFYRLNGSLFLQPEWQDYELETL
jgi:hypothetical protein